jgi:hypothetical protein
MPIKTEPKKRTRIPMDKFRAAVAIDRILARIPAEQRLAVLEFVKVPQQAELPGMGNA